MLANIQGARAEIKEMIQKIDVATEGGSEEDEQ
jgi:hypothetical protein